MSEPGRAAEIRRILVALDASPHSLPLLQVAAELASRMEAELLGLFVEDIELLRLADSPYACEILYPSATQTPLSRATMELKLRTLSEIARKALAAAASRAQVQWSFRTVCGESCRRSWQPPAKRIFWPSAKPAGRWGASVASPRPLWRLPRARPPCSSYRRTESPPAHAWPFTSTAPQVRDWACSFPRKWRSPHRMALPSCSAPRMRRRPPLERKRRLVCWMVRSLRSATASSTRKTPRRWCALFGQKAGHFHSGRPGTPKKQQWAELLLRDTTMALLLLDHGKTSLPESE